MTSETSVYLESDPPNIGNIGEPGAQENIEDNGPTPAAILNHEATLKMTP